MSDRVQIGDATAIRVGFGWTLGEQRLSSAIAKVTDGPYSHMLIGFALSDGRTVYYEALIGRGVDGPLDLLDVFDWRIEKEGRLAEIQWTHIVGIDAHKIMLECQADVDKRRAYNSLQLLSMLLLERTGIAIGSMRRDRGSRVVCSEFAAEKVFPHIDLRDEKRRTFSAVNPNSAWRRWQLIKGLHNAV